MSDPMNRAVEIPIDATGLVAEFDLREQPSREELVSVMLEASASADYEIYVGVRDPDSSQNITDEVYYFGNPSGGTPETSYTGVTEINDEWYQAEPFLGIWVTTAAAAGETATLAVSRGQ